MGKKEFGEYYLGLDIGTDSIGWAVTDLSYQVQKFNGKSMWGFRAFDEATPAQSRRQFRIQRRRLERRHQRLALLQELFGPEIEKADPQFFLRLKESRLHLEDRTAGNQQTIFSDNSFMDKDYYQKFPTIYHLRKHLMETTEKTDVRLLYLGIHHILKNRGHFLFEGDVKSLSEESSVRELLLSAQREWFDAYVLDLQLGSEDVPGIMSDREMGVRDKAQALEKAIGADRKNPQHTAIAGALAGKTFTLSSLFDKPALEEEENNKVSFAALDYEEAKDQLEEKLGEDLYLFEKLKVIYDWGRLSTIIGDSHSISEAKIRVYDRHRNDLALLKRVIRRYIPDQYKEVFSNPDKSGNYPSYVGYCAKNGRKIPLQSRSCSQADFNKYIRDLLSKVRAEDEELKEVFDRTASGKADFMPKIISKENAVIPYQLHAAELEGILSNGMKHHAFLREVGADGYSIADKVKMLLSFRIPYYVGPLNTKGENSKGWVIRHEEGAVRPWNFEKKIDLSASAEVFIRRMTSKCTYLRGEDVLPKQSLLYSRYMVLNELNNIRIDGIRLPVDVKQRAYQELFLTVPRVTMKKFREYLRTINVQGVISGIDGDFQSTLKPHLDMRRIFGNIQGNEGMYEDIIRWIVLFGEAKSILRRKIAEKYNLTDEEMKKVSSLRYSGWGRLSEKFLQGIRDVNTKTGEVGDTIIESLWNMDKNLMELLSREYGFTHVIENHNNSFGGLDKITYESVDELYVSPPVKRQIWQTLTIVRELHKIMGHEPKRVFIEMARGPAEKKRTVSRKGTILELYKSLKKEERDWFGEISAIPENRFRSDRLYFYYMQMGRCMYTGNPIDLGQIYNETLYDVDHIHPQSKVKDDSLMNRVLVDRNSNMEKSDRYPIDKSVRDRMKPFWQMLLQQGFLEKKKYERLTRSTPFSDGELAEFIARQLVETRQSTKAVAEILQRVYPASKIIYVKAGLVSDFRRYLGHVKSREVNDYHHAKDAYLNIVAGNIYHTRFTDNPYNFIVDAKKKGDPYSLKLEIVLSRDVIRGNLIAWERGGNKTRNVILKTLGKNNILFTRYSYTEKGQLFDVMLMKKGLGQLPIKAGLPIEKYGGYNKVKGAYFMLVEHTDKKGQRIRTIKEVPIYLFSQLATNERKEEYCKGIGFIDPDIKYSKIKIKSLIEVDGFRMHITGRQNDSLLVSQAHQLVLGQQWDEYIKKLVKFWNRALEFSKMNRTEHIKLSVYDQIETERNIALYDIFTDKLNNAIYRHKLKKQGADLLEKREAFMKLTAEDQVDVLLEILKFFNCNRVNSNLSKIGKGAHAGSLTQNSKITGSTSFKLINQSPTGLFEEIIDLLEV